MANTVMNFRDRPRADTPADVAWRLRDNAAREQAKREQAERFPTVTPENFQEAVDWFDGRVKELNP